MPVPKLFFILWVCVPCLFMDDAVRSELVPVNTAPDSREIYCQILQEKKNTSILSVIEESNVPVWIGVLLRPMRVVNVLPVGTLRIVHDENATFFALFSIQIQQHTSRRKADSFQGREYSLEKMMLRFPGETASLKKIGIEIPQEIYQTNPFLFFFGSITDHAFFDPSSARILSEFSDLNYCRHYCRFEFDSSYRKANLLSG